MRILIAGGGIGGLAAAIALRRQGIEAAVYERAAEYHPCGAAQTLWPNGSAALVRLGLGPQLARAGWPLVVSRILRSDGALLSETSVARFSAHLGVPALGIRRSRLQQLLLDAAEPGDIRTGAACTGFAERSGRIAALLETGESAEGDALVGADGLWSVVREQLFGASPPQRVGHTIWRCIVPCDDSALRAGRAFETWSRGERFGAIQVDEGHVYWYAAVNTPRPPASTNGSGPSARSRAGEPPADAAMEDLEQLHRRFGHWHDPIRALLAAAAPGDVIRTDIFDRRPLRRWGRGLITLLGDAAHPMTPDLGQGACQAIEDAVTLADCLAAAPADAAAALRRYERRSRHRTARISIQSHRLARIAQLRAPALCWLRDTATRLIPAAVFEDSLRRMVAPPRGA